MGGGRKVDGWRVTRGWRGEGGTSKGGNEGEAREPRQRSEKAGRMSKPERPTAARPDRERSDPPPAGHPPASNSEARAPRPSQTRDPRPAPCAQETGDSAVKAKRRRKAFVFIVVKLLVPHSVRGVFLCVHGDIGGCSPLLACGHEKRGSYPLGLRPPSSCLVDAKLLNCGKVTYFCRISKNKGLKKETNQNV